MPLCGFKEEACGVGEGDKYKEPSRERWGIVANRGVRIRSCDSGRSCRGGFVYACSIWGRAPNLLFIYARCSDRILLTPFFDISECNSEQPSALLSISQKLSLRR